MDAIDRPAAGHDEEALVFLDPRGEPSAPIEAYDCRLTKANAVIGLVCNGFPGAAALLDGLEVALVAREPSWTCRSYLKPLLSGEAPAAFLDRVAGECDAAIGAYGHCGSCTAGTVRDSVALARRGIASIALVTEHFTDCGNVVARGVGMPDVPRVSLPYPLAQLDPRALALVAADAADRVIAALREGR